MSHSGYEDPAKAMNRLAFLEGNWEGQGWYQAGPDAKRRHFTQTENIQRTARPPDLAQRTCQVMKRASVIFTHTPDGSFRRRTPSLVHRVAQPRPTGSGRPRWW